MNKRAFAWLAAGAVAAALTVIAAVTVLGVWPWQTAGGDALETAAAFGLPPLPASPDGTSGRDRVELGRKLFFDRRLSFNGTMSCAMCHVPEEGFASNASRTAVGIEGKSLRRNAPTVLNVAWQSTLFHDGRESSLATQAWMPLLHPDEMANPSIGNVLQRIRGLPDYHGQFERVFAGAGPTMDTLGAAIAAFELTLVAADSRFDRWLYGKQASALSVTEQLGYKVFSGKGRCTACHLIGERHALLADGAFHVTGAGLAQPSGGLHTVTLAPGVQTVVADADLAPYSTPTPPDLGRFEITLDPAHRYAFKTPSLRNVGRTAPYMHDGSLATLEDVVDFYDRGGGELSGKSERLAALNLLPNEKHALVAFLRSLDGEGLVALAMSSRQSTSP